MVSHTVYFKGMMVFTLTSQMYHRISVLVPVLVRVPEYLSTSTSTSTMTLELTSTSTVREIQYSSTTSTEYEYPSPVLPITWINTDLLTIGIVKTTEISLVVHPPNINLSLSAGYIANLQTMDWWKHNKETKLALKIYNENVWQKNYKNFLSRKYISKCSLQKIYQQFFSSLNVSSTNIWIHCGPVIPSVIGHNY